jgi:hypothetical protein
MKKNEDIDNFFEDIEEEKSAVLTDEQKKKVEEDAAAEEQKKKDEEQKKKDEEQKKKDDDEEVKLELERATSKKKEEKPTKDDSIATLRKQRDELASKVKQYEESGIDPQVIKPILDLITDSSDGVLDQSTVEAIVTEIKSKDKEINDLKEALQSKDQRIAEIDIRFSDEFKTKYEEPYKQSAQSLLLEFASITDDKKIIAPVATKKLHDALVEKSGELTAIDVKAMLGSFAKEFEEESGEQASIPTINSLMSAIRAFDKSRKDMQGAYQNWSTKRKEEEDKLHAEEEQNRDLLSKKEKRERIKFVNKAFKEFDFDSHDFLEEDKIKESFNEEYEFIEGIYNNPEKAPTHDVLISRGVKSRLWDSHLENYKRLIELEKEITKSKERPANRQPAKAGYSKDDDDWLGM